MIPSVLVALAVVSCCDQSTVVVRRAAVQRSVIVQNPQVFYLLGLPPSVRAAAPQTVSKTGVRSAGICTKCHSGEMPKGQFDLTKPLTDEQRLKAIRMVVSGKMPPDHALTGEQQGAVVKQLLQEPDP